MPRVNVETSALTDTRFERLGRRLQTNRYDALGRCTHVWAVCYDREAHALPVEDVDIAARSDGFAMAMVAADLAEDLGDGRVRICGTKGRIEWVSTQRRKAELGGAKNREAWLLRNAERERAAGISSDDGRAPASGESPRDIPRESPRAIPGDSPLSPALAPALALALAQTTQTLSGVPPDGAGGDGGFPSRGQSATLSLPGVPAPRQAPTAREAETARARAEAQGWLTWFNDQFGRRFQLRDSVVNDVRKLLVAGFTQRDMRMVAVFKKRQWARPEMEGHLVPATLLRPSKFGGYLDEAKSLLFRDEDDPQHRGRPNGPAALAAQEHGAEVIR